MDPGDRAGPEDPGDRAAPGVRADPVDPVDPAVTSSLSTKDDQMSDSMSVTETSCHTWVPAK